jgi:hypothetical protein
MWALEETRPNNLAVVDEQRETLRTQVEGKTRPGVGI